MTSTALTVPSVGLSGSSAPAAHHALLVRARRFVDRGGARAALTIVATAGILLPNVAPIAALGRWARLALGASAVARQLGVMLQASRLARPTPAPRS